ncbi:unnamed protein product [Cochlearia groenlandica]
MHKEGTLVPHHFLVTAFLPRSLSLHQAKKASIARVLQIAQQALDKEVDALVQEETVLDQEEASIVEEEVALQGR